MHALEAAFKVFLQVFKGLCRRSTTGDEDIVMIGMRTIVRQGGHGVLQAPANAVSDHGVADFLGDGEAEPRTGGARWFQYRLGFQDEGRGLAAPAATKPQEVAALLEGGE